MVSTLYKAVLGSKIVNDITSLHQDAIPYVLLTTLCAAAGILALWPEASTEKPTEAKSERPTEIALQPTEIKPDPNMAINAKQFTPIKLLTVTKTSPNTAIYRFELKDPNAVLNVPIGQHVRVRALISGKSVPRSYSPISGQTKGYFELLIKTYETSNMSAYISSLVPGHDSLDFFGPTGNFLYTPTYARHIGVIAGGTGITPIYPILKASLSDPSDVTKFSVLYSNKRPEDILLKKELDDMVKSNPGRVNVYYVLSQSSEADWTGGKGRITKEMIKVHLPPVALDVKVLMCGPSEMMKSMKAFLVEEGFAVPLGRSKLTDQVYEF